MYITVSFIYENSSIELNVKQYIQAERNLFIDYYKWMKTIIRLLFNLFYETTKTRKH